VPLPPPRLLLFIAALALPPPQASAGGVTLITHGFNSDITSWILPMASRFPGHPGFPGTDLTCYEIEITASGGEFAATSTRLDGPAPDASDSGEIVVKLDWSSIDTGPASSSQVAAAAANALLSTGLIPENNGRPLAELPLHLIGHSRGASVVSEISRELGKRGVWVDHLTLLDPVPVDTYGDAAVRIWENVLYADNFYQQLGEFLIPQGSPVSGAFNRKLVSLPSGYAFLSGANHSDVHLWYHGTVQLGTPATDTQASITSSMRSTWWTAAESSGAAAGFHYSRIGGGDRLSTATPAGSGTDAINAGYNRLWDLGAGTAANRSLVTAKNALWPSLITARRSAPASIPAGTAFDLELRYQSDDASAGAPVLTVTLDPDANPWNGNGIEIDTRPLSASGPANVLTAHLALTVPPALSGSYRIGARIQQSGRTRHLQAAGTLLVTPALPPPSIDRSSLGFSGGLFAFTILGSPGQSVRIEAAETLSDWKGIATRTLDGPTWIFSDPDTALHPKRFYRVVDAHP
jgi:hypothetical protein